MKMTQRNFIFYLEDNIDVINVLYKIHPNKKCIEAMYSNNYNSIKRRLIEVKSI